MVDLPAGLLHRPGPVRLLEKEEVALVETPHSIDCAFPHDQARPDPRVHLDGMPVVLALAGILPRKQGFQQRHVEEKRQERGKTGDGVLLAAVRIEELSAGHDRLRMLLHEGIQLVDGPLGENRIRVEQQRVAARHDPEGLVVGGGKAPVLVVFDPPDLRELDLQHGHAAVARRVVDDDDLEGDALDRAEDGLEAVAKKRFSVPVDDDDGKIHVEMRHSSLSKIVAPAALAKQGKLR